MKDERCRSKLLKKGQVLLLLLWLVVASGCWDRRELETLAVAFGMGLDQAPQGDGYEVSFQIVRAAQLQGPATGAGGGGGGGGETKPVWILRSTGPTVFEAVRNATFQSSRRLFLAHNQAVIISEKLARVGIYPALDFLIRDHEPRSSQWLLLTPDDPTQILDAAAGLERLSARAIADLMQRFYVTSQLRPMRLFDYIQTGMQKTTDSTLPIIRIKETAGKKELLIDGTGVLKGDRLVGYLDRKETRGLLWVVGEVEGGLITVDLPGGGKATFEIFNTGTKLEVKVNEGKVRAKVEVKVRSGLGAQTTNANLSTPAQFKRLEKLQSNAVEDEIRAALTKAKEYKADIFGFGEYLYKHDNKTWQQLQNDWERHFVEAEVEIKVESLLQELGLVTRPTTFKGPGEL